MASSVGSSLLGTVRCGLGLSLLTILNWLAPYVVGYAREIARELGAVVLVAGRAWMKITGWAKNLLVTRTMRRAPWHGSQHTLYNRTGREPGWELMTPEAVYLAERVVDRARRDGKRKLPWFWDKTFNLGWELDDRAWWVLTGFWHDVRYGADLAKIF